VLWLRASLCKLFRRSDTTVAIHYALTLWDAMVRYVDDGRIEIDNSAAERALRAVAVGRRNYLFAGSDRGGERAAVFHTLIGPAKLNGRSRGVSALYADPHRRPPNYPHRGALALERHPKSQTRKPTRSMKKAATRKDGLFDLASLRHLADLIDDGEISVGVLEPVGCVATAVDGSNCLAMLVRRDGETLAQLLTRLDLAVGLAFAEDMFTDEVNAASRKK
jgi:hypothetical protein